MYLHISQRAIHKAARQIEQDSGELLAHLGLTPAEPQATAAQR
jgi:hypothetical protein